MGPSPVWLPNRSKSGYSWELALSYGLSVPGQFGDPFQLGPLLLPSALSPPAPSLPPSAVSSREISASDFEKRRWRIPSLPLFSLFGPSLRLLPAKTRHSTEHSYAAWEADTRVSLFLDQNFKPVGACSAYSIATSFFFPGHLIPAAF